MRIRRLYVQGVYPLYANTESGLFRMDFFDDIDDGDRVLLVGSNGSGKSTVLRAVALMWKTLLTRVGLAIIDQPLPERNAQGALLISGLAEKDLLIARGDVAFMALLKELEPDAILTGYCNGEAYGRDFNLMEDSPNMLYLDADSLYAPEATIGGVDDALITDAARFTPESITKHWHEHPETTESCLEMLNGYFQGKRFAVVGGDVRVIVGNHVHGIKRLSAGEKHALSILYALHYHLKPGGVVLADEPDMHLHYAAVPGLIAAMENSIAEKNGQFILTSHIAAVKQRYEQLGLLIPMDEEAPV